jgi:hypothetical protein
MVLSLLFDWHYFFFDASTGEFSFAARLYPVWSGAVLSSIVIDTADRASSFQRQTCSRSVRSGQTRSATSNRGAAQGGRPRRSVCSSAKPASELPTQASTQITSDLPFLFYFPL